MKKIKILRLTYIAIATLLLISCEKNPETLDLSPSGQNVTIIEKEDVNKDAILPEAIEYYQNIATMARWYSKHPQIAERSRLKNATNDSINPLLLKLDELSITDSLGNDISIFDLDGTKLDTFLTSFVIIESEQLSEKLKELPTEDSKSEITETNKAFRAVFSNKKSLESTLTDPYWKISNKLKEQEKTQDFSKLDLKSGDSGFWFKVISNYALQISILHIAPNSLSKQTFVNRLRRSVQKGRLLIALPGGFTTTFPIVFYPNKKWYDVGHVAIMVKNSNEIPQKISNNENDEFYFTMGTNPENGMHKEKDLKEDWCDKHGVAFVGQVFDVKWVWFKKNWHHWGWRKERRDVNNYNIYSKALSIKGKPYCKWYQVMTAKWSAPDRFICSSTAWWCAKKGTGVNISSWWKTTIFPAGVYLSDRVRIVDNTLH